MSTAFQTVYLDEGIQNRHPCLMDGSALCQVAFDDDSTLNAISDALTLQRVTSFYAESAQECFDKIGEDVPDGMDPDDGLAWFEPEVGLGVIEQLLLNAPLASSSPDVIEDLKNLKAELEFAVQNRTLFRLVIVF